MFAISQNSQTGKLNLKTKRAYHKQNTTYDTLFVVLLCLLLRLFHLAQQLFLSVIQRGWQLHVVCYDEVAHCAIAPIISLATQAHLRAVLRFWLYFQFYLRSVAKLYYHLAAE